MPSPLPSRGGRRSHSSLAHWTDGISILVMSQFADMVAAELVLAEAKGGIRFSIEDEYAMDWHVVGQQLASTASAATLLACHPPSSPLYVNLLLYGFKTHRPGCRHRGGIQYPPQTCTIQSVIINWVKGLMTAVKSVMPLGSGGTVTSAAPSAAANETMSPFTLPAPLHL